MIAGGGAVPLYVPPMDGDGRDRHARALLALMLTFPGGRVLQTTAGIRQRVEHLARSLGPALSPTSALKSGPGEEAA